MGWLAVRVFLPTLDCLQGPLFGSLLSLLLSLYVFSHSFSLSLQPFLFSLKPIPLWHSSPSLSLYSMPSPSLPSSHAIPCHPFPTNNPYTYIIYSFNPSHPNNPTSNRRPPLPALARSHSSAILSLTPHPHPYESPADSPAARESASDAPKRTPKGSANPPESPAPASSNRPACPWLRRPRVAAARPPRSPARADSKDGIAAADPASVPARRASTSHPPKTRTFRGFPIGHLAASARRQRASAARLV